MEQRKSGPVQTMVGSALGVLAVGIFSVWASRQHLYPPLIPALSVFITGIVIIITNNAVGFLVRIDLRTVAGWLAIAFVVWWIMEQPEAAQHVVVNIGGFLSASAAALTNIMTSI